MKSELSARMHHVQFMTAMALAFISMICAQNSFAKDPDASVITASEVRVLLAELNRPFNDTPSLSYLVERTLSSDKGSASDSWTFSFSKPGSLRIEYLKPESRLIIKNENYVWEYLKKHNRVMQIDISDYSQQEQADMLESALKRVALRGLKPGSFDGLPNESFTAISSEDVLTISNSARPRYLLKIDKTKNVLMHSEIYNMQDELVIRSTASQHKLISKGFWLPALIKNTIKADKTYIESVIKISGATAGKPIPKERYVFDKPKNVVIIEK